MVLQGVEDLSKLENSSQQCLKEHLKLSELVIEESDALFTSDFFSEPFKSSHGKMIYVTGVVLQATKDASSSGFTRKLLPLSR